MVMFRSIVSLRLTMAVNPVQYLLSPRLLASVIMLPLLCALYLAIGMFGSYLVTTGILEGDFGIWMQSIRDTAVPKDLWMGLIKPFFLGLAIVSIGCHVGLRTRGGTQGVGRATTNAVVASSVAVIAVDYLVTQLLIVLMY